ncbi:hypothetical protein [Variovorax sp. HW608]|uniref:hypothetical protein n=1 Tax=Variovorax sp. HW608 TaxID=1034889 RepID=UPI000B5AC6EA|nr:hypothetical protein [Variovorax sp. HW608]
MKILSDWGSVRVWESKVEHDLQRHAGPDLQRLLADAQQSAHRRGRGGTASKAQGLADENYSFVLIAHSQGNLFVNSAYDGLRSSHPDTAAGVVHVAPASPTLRGEHLLADIDLVINGLRVQGINSVAANNINLPASKSDLSGHTLVGTYLDAARAAREKINGMVQAVLGKL